MIRSKRVLVALVLGLSALQVYAQPDRISSTSITPSGTVQTQITPTPPSFLTPLFTDSVSSVGQPPSQGTTQGTATLRRLEASAAGNGTTSMGVNEYISSGVSSVLSAKTTFDFVNPSDPSNLYAPETTNLQLSFNFHLQGHLVVNQTSQSGAFFQYNAEVKNGVGIPTSFNSDITTLVYGPVPTLQSNGNVTFQDGYNPDNIASPLVVDHRFSLVTSYANPFDPIFGFPKSGSYNMFLQLGATNDASSVFSLELESVTMLSGAPGVPLGLLLRHDYAADSAPFSSGLLLVTSAVPETSTYMMMLAGLAMVSQLARRRGKKVSHGI